jgi:hypothetical protein
MKKPITPAQARLISAAMAILGSRTSPRKAAAARRNAQTAGRPKGSKDSKPRKKRKTP